MCKRSFIVDSPVAGAGAAAGVSFALLRFYATVNHISFENGQKVMSAGIMWREANGVSWNKKAGAAKKSGSTSTFQSAKVRYKGRQASQVIGGVDLER